MNKKYILILCGLVMLLITGCGNNELDNNSSSSNNNKSSNNNLVCKGKTSLLVCKGKTSLMEDISAVEQQHSSSEVEYYLEYLPMNEYIENGVYTFVYNNAELQSVKGKENWKLPYSSQEIDKEIQNMKEQSDIKIYRDGSNTIIMEYTLDEQKNEIFFNALRNQKNLKDWLENYTNLTCSK